LKNKELQAYLTRFPDDSEVVILEIHKEHGATFFFWRPLREDGVVLKRVCHIPHDLLDCYIETHSERDKQIVLTIGRK